MSKFVNMLIAGAASIALAGAAMAGGKGDNNNPVDWLNVHYGLQVNVATVYSLLNLNADWVGGNLRAQSAAIGNNISYTAEGSTLFDSKQSQFADVGAELNAVLSNVGGDIDLSVVAICNNDSVNVTKAGKTAIMNDQRCMTEDPYAIANVSVAGGGSLAVSAASIANNFSATVETASLFTYNHQWNPADVYTTVNADVSNIGGDVAVTAAAIGNNMVVNSGFGGK